MSECRLIPSQINQLSSDVKSILSRLDESERPRSARQTTAEIADLANLLSALGPFAKVANGIPPNWPDDVTLTIELDHTGRYIHLGYSALPSSRDHPTIGDWRRLGEVLAVIGRQAGDDGRRADEAQGVARRALERG